MIARKICILKNKAGRAGRAGRARQCKECNDYVDVECEISADDDECEGAIECVAKPAGGKRKRQ